VTTAPPWEAWAPPLDPPTAGGLPVGQAETIAAAWWADDPHLAAALMWESYAATLDPTLAVSMVNTGAQSVSYGTARPGGEYGLAVARAEWHRSFTTAVSVPLRVRLCPWSGRAGIAGARSTPTRPGGAGRIAGRRSGRRRRCLRAGRRSAPRSSPRSRGAPSAGRPRPTCTTSADAMLGTARTTSGRCAAGATDTSPRSRPGGCPRRDLRGSRARVGGKCKTWVRASGAGRYPLQATTLRGTRHPRSRESPTNARRRRCWRSIRGSMRVHGWRGGQARRGALRTAPCGAVARRCWLTAQRRAGRVPRHSLPWQLPGRAAGAVAASCSRPGGLDRAGRVRGRGRCGREQQAVGWPVILGRAGPRSEPGVRGRMAGTRCRGSGVGCRGHGSDTGTGVPRSRVGGRGREWVRARARRDARRARPPCP